LVHARINERTRKIALAALLTGRQCGSATDRHRRTWSAPCSHLWEEARKRERVRCSSLVDWPVYPRLRRTMRASKGGRNSGRHSPPTTSHAARACDRVGTATAAASCGWAASFAAANAHNAEQDTWAAAGGAVFETDPPAGRSETGGPTMRQLRTAVPPGLPVPILRGSAAYIPGGSDA
jgi:hypothetical protein